MEGMIVAEVLMSSSKKIIRELDWEKKRMTRYSIDIYLSTHILNASCNKDKCQNTFSLR
jgi:hypothetical protein